MDSKSYQENNIWKFPGKTLKHILFEGNDYIYGIYDDDNFVQFWNVNCHYDID